MGNLCKSQILRAKTSLALDYIFDLSKPKDHVNNLNMANKSKNIETQSLINLLFLNLI